MADSDYRKESRRVLVVDDDPTIRELMQFGLEDEGYSVITADAGSSLYFCLSGAWSALSGNRARR